MNILIIGSGGREHALAWKIAQSPDAQNLYAIPGNPGIAEVATCVTGISIEDNAAVVSFAQKHAIDLVVIGPEVPLMHGLADAIEAAGILAFGPRQQAAAIEGSKAFSKELMQKYGIPTAKYEIFSDAAAAKAYVQEEGAPIVIKADGLAAGKGVIVAMTLDEALAAITEIMEDQEFGQAGSRVVIEEFMAGEEASLLAFTDGETIIPMVSSQDHKRAYDGDQGPNTGGMGTYAPAPVMTASLVKEATEKILQPAIQAMAKEGRKYQGCLYAGLMITPAGPKVVEFNARFGDPETQVVLPLLKSDILPILVASAKGDGSLKKLPIEWANDAAVCVVLASGGYPKVYQKGYAITGLEQAQGALIFHAGTAEKDGQIVTAGGRVLGVVAVAKDIPAAVQQAYAAVDKIDFTNKMYRHDIAQRALARLGNSAGGSRA